MYTGKQPRDLPHWCQVMLLIGMGYSRTAGRRTLSIRRAPRRRAAQRFPSACKRHGSLANTERYPRPLQGESTDVSDANGEELRHMSRVQTPRQRSRWLPVFVRLLCGGLLTLGPVYAWAVDNEESRATLRGIIGIEVGVGQVIPAVARAGVTQEAIRNEVTRRLRGAGIALLSRGDLLKHPDAAFLAVSVGAIRHPAGMLYAYSIDVGVYQTATLARDATIALSLPTWSSASFGLVGATNLRDLLPSVGARVEQFVKAYIMVNPRAEGQKMSQTRAGAPTPAKGKRGRSGPKTPKQASLQSAPLRGW